VVLRRDHLEAVALASEFFVDQLGNLGIEIAQTFIQDAHADAPFKMGSEVLNIRFSITDISIVARIIAGSRFEGQDSAPALRDLRI